MMPILSLMNTDMPSLQSSDPIEKAIDLFRTNTIHAAPVMENGRLAGIITLVSVYQFLSRPGHYASCPVEWIMLKPPITISPSAEIADAARLMRDNHVFTVPVIRDDALVGLLSVERLLEHLIND